MNTQFIYYIRLKIFLSYGNQEVSLELRPLNVIVGANGSGKSNFLEAIRLLRLAPSPQGLLTAVKRIGGIEEVLWKGDSENKIAEIEIVTVSPHQSRLNNGIGLLYRIYLENEEGNLKLSEEAVEEVSLSDPFPKRSFNNHQNSYKNGHNHKNGNHKGYNNGNNNGNGNGNGHNNDNEFYYRLQKGIPTLNYRGTTLNGTDEQRLRRLTTLKVTQTALSELKDPQTYPEISFLGNKLSQFAIYRGWKFTPGFPPRMPSLIEQRSDFLSENGRNLPLVLRELSFHPATKAKIIKQMQRFFEGFEDYEVLIEGNAAKLFVKEKSLESLIPANRLSDGMLRYICLLTILCHPNPPSVICLEEPEVGLHPEIMSTLAELLLEASQKTQLIVTTHSESLISALSVAPESVVVCERREDGTNLRRLDMEKVSDLMNKYTLGKLWRLGTIGGTRRIW